MGKTPLKCVLGVISDFIFGAHACIDTYVDVNSNAKNIWVSYDESES